jgi:hypothetical protein
MIDQHLAGGGQRTVFGRPVEELLTYFQLEPANSLANRWLGAAKDLGRPRKAALASDRDKNFKLVDIHSILLNYRFTYRNDFIIRTSYPYTKFSLCSLCGTSSQTLVKWMDCLTHFYCQATI